MVYKVGDVVKTKKSPKIFGYVTDVIFVDEKNKIIPQIFFEDSDEPEWCYKESYDIVENKRDIRYMTFLYNDWRNENV
jgi:hypothetical protein